MDYTVEEKEERDYHRAMEVDLKLREVLQDRPDRVVVPNGTVQHYRALAAMRKGKRLCVVKSDFDGS